jgi:transposase
MAKKKRIYTEEFKREALELLQSSDQSTAQVERDLGITPGLLTKWRGRYEVKQANGETTLTPSDLAAAQAEIKQLRRQLAVAEQERDILKKAVSIFSKMER